MSVTIGNLKVILNHDNSQILTLVNSQTHALKAPKEQIALALVMSMNLRLGMRIQMDGRLSIITIKNVKSIGQSVPTQDVI